MRTVSVSVLPSRYVGDSPVIVTLEYDAIKAVDGSLFVLPGSSVGYRVSDGHHVITGNDLHAAYMGDVSGADMLRALCSFLSADREHIAYGHHTDRQRCHEYGAGCPMYRAAHVAALDAMGDAIEDGSVELDESDDNQREPDPGAVAAQHAAVLTYA